MTPTTGIYSGIFAIHLKLYTSRNGPDRGRNILFYCLCVLYALCGACIIINTVIDVLQVSNNDCPCLTSR